jgi:hypothetical protein
LIWRYRVIKREKTQKRNAIALEIIKIRGWLQLIIDSPARASQTQTIRTSLALPALVRLGPSISSKESLEPCLAELEHRLGMVEAAAAGLFNSTTGIATALRGNEVDIDKLQEVLRSEATKAMKALLSFEQSALDRKVDI